MDGAPITLLVAQLTLQVALVLCAARIGGEIAERWLGQPAVLGELAAGVAVGPFALGALPLPALGALFPGRAGPIGVSDELYALAQLGSIVLLFVAGLETDLRQFLRFGPGAALVALGGVIVPFALGAASAVSLGLARSLGDPHALFLGAILTATSVGITARVLGDIGKLDTPEGVTILAAAVIDDVLGILVLAMVVGAASGGGGSSTAGLALISLRAIGAWLGLTIAFLALASAISRVAMRFRVEGAGLAIALATGFLGAYVADRAGLALIIGAYSAGLALSTTPLKAQLDREMRAVYNVFVPIFFVVTGMLVDLRAMAAALGIGLVIVLLAVVGKLVGCGLPALAAGFNPRGALRVGVGMLPRGEVALVVATAGLSAGIVDQTVFGAAIFVAAATTLLAPPLLVPTFRLAGGGLRGGVPAPAPSRAAARTPRWVWTLTPDAATSMAAALDRHLLVSGFRPLVHAEAPGEEVIQYRRDALIFGVELRALDETEVRLRVEASGEPDAEAVVASAVRAAGAAAAEQLLFSLSAAAAG